MRRFLPLAVLVLAACANKPMPTPTTEVLLIVDATPTVRMHTARLHVEISGSTLRDGPFSGTVVEEYGPLGVAPSPPSAVGYPRRFGLVPQDGDSKRFFEARATAFDTMGMEVAATIVRSGYVEHELLVLRVVLDDVCHGVMCPADQICRHGVCQPIFVDPGMLPQGDAGPPGADGGSGTDLGTLPDGGAPPDATMPPLDGFVSPPDGAAPDAPGPPPVDGGPIDAGCTTTSCDDHNACNGVEDCIEGSCAPGMTLICDDGVACTHDSCDPTLGCRHASDDALCGFTAGGTCDPSSGCQYPTCSSATCVSDPSMCMTAACSGATCVRSPTCAGAQVCCAGTCANPGCNDGNPCTTDACGATGCTHTNNANPCSDGVACTVGDHCSGGSCAAGAPSCDDGNLCTDDTCGVGGCAHSGNSVPCDADGDPCTVADHCDPMTMGCVAGMRHFCDDGNDCTDDFCAPDGTCGTLNNSNPCDSALLCRSGLCVGGFCRASGTGGCDISLGETCCGGVCTSMCF